MDIVYRHQHNEIKRTVKVIELQIDSGKELLDRIGRVRFRAGEYNRFIIEFRLRALPEDLRQALPPVIWMSILAEIQADHPFFKLVPVPTAPPYFAFKIRGINSYTIHECFGWLEYSPNFIGTIDDEVTIGVESTEEEILWVCNLLLKNLLDLGLKANRRKIITPPDRVRAK